MTRSSSLIQKVTTSQSMKLKYMRAFAEAYPDEQIVQQVVAQIPWGHNVRILDAVKDTNERQWCTLKLAW